MAQYFLLFLITVHFFVIFADASETVHTLSETNVAPASSNAAAPTARRLGKHRNKHNTVKLLPEAPHMSPVGLPRTRDNHDHEESKHDTVKLLPKAPHMSPVGLPQTKDNHDHEDSNKDNKVTDHHDPHIAPTGETEAKKHHHHHESVLEESVAGGGVIVGGLATTFLVAIFCYIRATRRNSSNSPTSSSL